LDSWDAWVFEPGRAPQQLTRDGRTVAVSASPSGDLLLNQWLPDGRYVVILKDRDGATKLVTPGPSDSLPSFSADGAEWVYSAYDRRAIVRCSGHQCRDVVHEKQMPVWPALSPDHAWIAYITGYGMPRLRLAASYGGDLRDLGPTAMECPPIWTSAERIWAFTGVGSTRSWQELDATSGKATGRSKPVRGFNGETNSCGREAEEPGSPFYQRVRVEMRQSLEIWSTNEPLGRN
jgi:hypothetical protein